MGKKNRKHVNPKHTGSPHKKLERNKEAFWLGYRMVESHPIFFEMMSRFYGSPATNWIGYHRIEVELESYRCPREAWIIVTSDGVLHPNVGRAAEPTTWAYIVAHAVLHLALNHFQAKYDAVAWNVACDYVAAKFLASFKSWDPPHLLPLINLPQSNEADLYAAFVADGIPNDVKRFGLSEPYVPDMEIAGKPRFSAEPPDYPDLFAIGLRDAMTDALYEVSDANVHPKRQTMPHRARQWFVNNYPLLGALAASFEIIEDVKACRALQIRIAAVDASQKRIYFNPPAYQWSMDGNYHMPENRLRDEAEVRFVMAHELLHVALRHHARQQGRDPYLWNVACDYVINDWLVQMGVGRLPDGCLYDPALKGLNAEAVYDRIVNDMRTYRKLATLRGVGLCDVLGGETAAWWALGAGLRLDEFYRRALANGFEHHCRVGRGYLPAGLVEEINALSQPPIPWDVKLAQWFDARFPPMEKRRTYARPSRRQAATPDIPRASYALTESDVQSRTFGVVLDTSGSMDKKLLAKALGTIASYSQARDVGAVRVVFCDAAPYDAGYMLPEEIAERVQVKGRGGTVLQPGIDLLEHAGDFPRTGPILVITDGYCDVLRVRRDHAYVVPDGHSLPFSPRGEVFYIS